MDGHSFEYGFAQNGNFTYKCTTCGREQAVRNIKQYFSGIHKRIYNSFYNYEEDKLNDYLDDYYIYKEKIDKCSSINNLKEMEKYLKSI